MSPIEAKDFGIVDKVLVHPMQEEEVTKNLPETGLEIANQPSL